MAVRKQSGGHVQATLDAGDIQLGAVELKDGDSDVRQDVGLVTARNAAYTQSEDGGHVATGATTDPAASPTVAEDATARTGIGLWKGIKNILILIKNALTVTPVVTPETGSGAVATSYAPAAAFWLKAVTLHLSAVPTTNEDFIVTLNANDGAVYDTVLARIDPSTIANGDDLLYQPDGGPLLCEAGDGIDVAYPNTDTNTYGVRIVTREA